MLLIEWISTWAEQIIVAVIIGTIIEMILPNGNNKKYIKTVIGIYILFTIVSPVISKISNKDITNIDLNYEKYFKNTDTYQTMSQSLANSNDKTVENIYINNLKQDMKNKMLERGYVATDIQVQVILDETSNYGKINQISLRLEKKKETEETDELQKNIGNEIYINTIEKVNIGNNTNTIKHNTVGTDTIAISISSNEINEIKEYLSNVYEIKKKNIQIN